MDSEEARIYSAVLITCGVLGTVFIYFFVSIVRQQRRNMQLQKQNSHAEINAIEKERSRIAADLHDEIAPYLTAIKLKISDFDMHDTIGKQIVETRIDEILNRIREISFDLMPTALLRKGLLGGIAELMAHIKRSYSIEIAMVADETLELSEQKAINIFRIVQEVLHNAVKHAKATEILIVIENKPGLLIVKIADNGVGMDYGLVLKETKGFGLRSIQNRAALLGGQVFVQTSPQKGMSYLFEFPD